MRLLIPMLESQIRAQLRAHLPPDVIRLIKNIRSYSRHGFRSFQEPIVLARLEQDLRRAGIGAGDVVMVHASLSGIGRVEGGAETVIRSLKNVLTSEGTLLMPCFESASEVLRAAASGETIDLRSRPCETGRIAETFRAIPGVLRSSHPFSSVCAWGKHADFLTSGHEGDSRIWHKESPLARLLSLKGKNLGLGGISVANMTFLHVVEDAQPDFPVQPYSSAVSMRYIDDRGRSVSRLVCRHDPAISATRIDRPLGSWARTHFTAAFERDGAMRRFTFGGGTAWAIDAIAGLETLKAEASRGITIYSTRSTEITRRADWCPPRLREHLVSWSYAVRRPWLSAQARAIRAYDVSGAASQDPGPESASRAAHNWICLAQDRSTSADGGVSRDFSLITGWADSYPETTGYIVPTMLDYAETFNVPQSRNRARRMLDWLASIQLDSGAFQGGTIRARERVPVAFNTGQVLLGLAAGVRAFPGKFEEPLRRGGLWMVRAQDADGAWSRYASPFASPGPKAYDVHAAWGLLAAADALGDDTMLIAALANARWTLRRQRPNGWLDDCCLTDARRPLTHTIGYALRGLVEAYRVSKNPIFLNAAVKTGRALADTLRSDGALPGRLDQEWRAASSWTCLTGNLQVALSWFSLHDWTREPLFLASARAVNAHARRTVMDDGPSDINGGIRGSLPLDGGYNPYAFLSWGTKFFLDSQLAEIRRV